MTFLHYRYRNRLGLLAASALPQGEADSLLRHTLNCASCREELSALTAAATLLRDDAATDRPLPISSEALRTRVLARIRSEAIRPAARRSLWLSPATGLAGLVAAGLLMGLVVSRFVPSSEPGRTPATAQMEAPPVSETLANDEAFYARLEKTQLRASAVRYLAEAQDVLMQVTAASVDCPDSPEDSVDVTRESRTSRSLLSRRAALVSGSQGTLVAARGVLEEVEGVLQQVADLPQCTRRTDVDAIVRRVDGKKLMMKIELVTQELAAP